MKALALLVACCIVLSGCSDKKKDDDPDPTTSSSSTSTSGSPTGNGTIEVLLNRTTPNGAVPLAVNFTIDAVFRSSAGAVVPTPAAARWEVLVSTANGTAHEDGFTDAPSGTGLPADVSYNLTAPGNVTFSARVHAPGFASGTASFLVIANATGGPASIFFEGGEADGSQWTLESRVFFNPNLMGSAGAEEVPEEEHPDGPWAISDGAARTGTHSWLHPYPDLYRTRMTSVPIDVPAGGATLSYALKGGAEDTAVEGLFVLAGPEGEAREVVAEHRGLLADWTVFTVELPAGSLQVEFRFDSDLSCGNDSGPPPGFTCGEGFDAGGFYLDDITVA